MALEQIFSARVGVRSARLADVFVVTAAGELDLFGADLLRAELDRVEEAGATRLVVDLLRVGFVDSATLGVLALAAKRVDARGGRIVLVVDDPRTLRVLEVTGLDGVFALERSLPAAFNAASVQATGGRS